MARPTVSVGLFGSIFSDGLKSWSEQTTTVAVRCEFNRHVCFRATTFEAMCSGGMSSSSREGSSENKAPPVEGTPPSEEYKLPRYTVVCIKLVYESKMNVARETMIRRHATRTIGMKTNAAPVQTPRVRPCAYGSNGTAGRTRNARRIVHRAHWTPTDFVHRAPPPLPSPTRQHVSRDGRRQSSTALSGGVVKGCPIRQVRRIQ